MGFFSGLHEEKYARKYTDRQLTGRILEYFKTQRRRIAWISVLVMAYATVGASLPVLVGRAVDLLKAEPMLGAIGVFGGGLVLIGVLNWGLIWARRSLMVRTVGDVVLDLRTRAFRAAAEHDLSFYDQFSSGRIVSRITSDTNDFGQLVIIITDVLAQLVQTILLSVILFRTEWRLA